MQPSDSFEEEQIEAAASEAGAIGGHPRYAGADAATRPLIEAGEGVAEGFELAEEDLIDTAEGDYRRRIRAFPAEPEGEETVGDYGEADFEASTEAQHGDR